MTVYRIELNGPGGGLVVTTELEVLDQVRQLLAEASPGDSVMVAVDEMTAEQLAELPEHGGW